MTQQSQEPQKRKKTIFCGPFCYTQRKVGTRNFTQSKVGAYGNGESASRGVLGGLEGGATRGWLRQICSSREHSRFLSRTDWMVKWRKFSLTAFRPLPTLARGLGSRKWSPNHHPIMERAVLASELDKSPSAKSPSAKLGKKVVFEMLPRIRVKRGWIPENAKNTDTSTRVASLERD